MATDGSDRTLSTGGGDRQPVSSNRLLPKGDPLLGTVFAERYTILQVLGRGGMGVVYKGRHDLMDRLVAIKMMLPQLVCDEVSLARFQREARAASKINHPNIIAIHDFGITPDSGVPYLVMDYIEGQTLSTAIEHETQLGVSRTVRIFLQVCDALQHAHRLGVIHRDLKPGNIMLVNHGDMEDFVKVVDFGVAKMASAENETDQQKLTSTGEIFGSPIYMSPEQCGGESLDARSDVYALGCVLYETLTGKPPCVGKNALETIARHISTTPPPFNTARPDLYIPEWIETIVFKALEKSRDNRQQSMKELFEELYAGMAASSSPAQMKQLSTSVRTRVAAAQPTPGSPMPTLAKGSHKNNITLWITAGMGFLAAAAACGAFIWYSRQPPPTKPSAQQHTPGAQTAKGAGTAATAPPHQSMSRTAPVAPPAEVLAKPAPPAVPKAKHQAEPVAAKIHFTAAKPAATSSRPAETVEPVAPRRRAGGDFYDYAVRTEGEGLPVDIPTGKPFGNQ